MRVKDLLTVTIATLLILATAPPAAMGGGSDGGETVIGTYVVFGIEDDLTDDDVRPIEDGLVVDAPDHTSEIRVDAAFLRERLGSWATDRSYTVEDDRIVVDGEDVPFRSFAPGATPVFTRGSNDSIRLSDRPMWASVDDQGDRLVLDLHDGDETGQTIRIAKQWLWDHGIHRPNATHADGTDIPVRDSTDREAFLVDVPHFSEVYLTGTDIDVKIRQEGVLTDHTGEKRWNSTSQHLEVDVGDHLAEIGVLVEKDWVDMHIDHLAVVEHNFTVQNVSDRLYYVVELAASETPATLVFEEFKADDRWVFTRGNPTTVSIPVWAFLKLNSSAGNLSVTTRPPVGSNVSQYPVFINDTFLQDRGITSPVPYTESNARLDLGADQDLTYFHVTANGSTSAQVQVRNGSGSMVLTDDGTCDRASMENEADFRHDNGEGSAAAQLYVAGRTFCFDWRMSPGTDIGFNDIDYWKIYGNVTDINHHLLCEIEVPAGDPIEAYAGAKECHVDEDTAIPSTIRSGFHAHSADRKENALWWAEKGVEFVGEVCQAGAVGIAFYNPDPSVTKAYAVICGVVWAVNGAFDGQLLPDEDQYDIATEGIITNALKTVDISSAIRVDLVDTNDDRDDTWDILENNDLQHLLRHPRGPQSIDWMIDDIEDGELSFDSDISEIDSIDPTDTNAEEYDLTWRAGEPDLEAHAKQNDFSATIDLTKVDWEAPEPLWEHARLEVCQSDPSAYVDVDIEPIDPDTPPKRDEPAWGVQTINFSAELDSDNMTEGGNVSLADVDHWDSMVQAFANVTTTNKTFVQDTCLAVDLDNIEEELKYTYDSPFSVTGIGYSETTAQGEVTDTDSETLPIDFQYVPHDHNEV